MAKTRSKIRQPSRSLTSTCFLLSHCTSLPRGSNKAATDFDVLPCSRGREKPACPHQRCGVSLRSGRHTSPPPRPRYSHGGQGELGHGGDAADLLQGVVGEVGRRAGPRVEQAARQRQGGGPAPTQPHQRPEPPAARSAQLHLHRRPRSAVNRRGARAGGRARASPLPVPAPITSLYVISLRRRRGVPSAPRPRGGGVAMAKPPPARCAAGPAERGGRLAGAPDVAAVLPGHGAWLYRWRRLTTGAGPKVTGPGRPRDGGGR